MSNHALARQAIVPDAEQPDPGKGNPAGLWLTTVSIDGQAVFQAFEAFTGDGLEFLNDNGSPIEGNVCFGYWTSTGKNIKVIHPSWNYDMNGNLIGTIVITSNVTLDPGGNTFKGNVSVEAFGLDGSSQGIVLQAALTGKRLSS
jgi:hypothetical protein